MTRRRTKSTKSLPPEAKRGPGRPRVGEGETIAITVRLPEAVHAELEREAERRGVSIGDIVRERIAAA